MSIDYNKIQNKNITKPQIKNGSMSHLNSNWGESCVMDCGNGRIMT